MTIDRKGILLEPHYTLVRSGRKTVALEITKDLQLLVRAPYHLPQETIDHFVSSHSQWIETQQNHMMARALAYPEPSREEAERLRTLAKEYLPSRVAYFSELMKLTPTAVTITGAKTRFGSCSGTNRLCFSWRLMLYPKEAIDYVVVHELSHIVHKNHSAAFYDLIASYLPDWKRLRQLLRP